MESVKGCVKKTIELKNGVNLDLDDKGEIIGVEII